MSFFTYGLWSTFLLLLGLIKEPTLSLEDVVVRGFLNISIACQITSLDVTLFCVYTTMLEYEANKNIIEIG